MKRLSSKSRTLSNTQEIGCSMTLNLEFKNKVDLLTLYLHHFKAKASDFAETLINDPDMNKISFEKQAEVNFLTGIAKFYDEAVSFKK